ncbi:MAG: hypothetical protein ACRC5C_07735 [Bacilli bacterium]
MNLITFVSLSYRFASLFSFLISMYLLMTDWDGRFIFRSIGLVFWAFVMLLCALILLGEYTDPTKRSIAHRELEQHFQNEKGERCVMRTTYTITLYAIAIIVKLSIPCIFNTI